MLDIQHLSIGLGLCELFFKLSSKVDKKFLSSDRDSSLQFFES